MHVNLLSASIRSGLLLRRRLRQWSVICGVLATVGVANIAWQYRQLSQNAREWETLDRRCEKLHEMEAKANVLQARLAALRNQSANLKALIPSQPTVPLLGVVSRNVQLTEGRLFIQRLAFQAASQAQPGSAQTAPVGAAAAAIPAELATVQIFGAATEDAAVAQFVEGLRKAAVFRSVDLRSTSQLRAPGRGGRQFQVECRF